ncbi:hypothetical protein NY2A_b561R [Paramecium bursaria Chlorella virus NY2A]|uniref:Uncharacterized protein b561R n=1 Tax=Paramecium bursaria Chlorella virus NY2A TaxID=46021 RepID=A7IX86_PBCVN|nr:hypothetical protein NY2A_b561R [Paramecium bursaria Chlorella virus NY2A]ABT14960.1 hypothetical protein NY2A_b561R [Paramecium bursaria Chlorella virus NY2A]
MSIKVLMYSQIAFFVLSEMLLFHMDFTSIPGTLTMLKNVSSLAVTRCALSPITFVMNSRGLFGLSRIYESKLSIQFFSAISSGNTSDNSFRKSRTIELKLSDIMSLSVINTKLFKLLRKVTA